MGAGSLGRTGWEWEEMEPPSVGESSRMAWSSALRWRTHVGDIAATVCFRARAQEKEED